jgi:hypothetical protein
VKKILSILLALGVILGLTLAAAPVAAQVDCPDDCTPIAIDDIAAGTPPDFCAGTASDYLLGDGVASITLPVTLVPGADSLSVDFPPGTDLASVVAAGVWVIDWTTLDGPYNPTAITKDGTHLEFVVPPGFLPLTGMLWAGDIITIQVDGVVNPTVAGDYCLYVDYKFDCCDPVQFDCVEYTVSPYYCTLDFVFDFSPTYAGLAPGFIPPFKACGQDGYGVDVIGVGWMTLFDLIIDDVVPGCHPPCPSAKLWFEVTKCPEDEVITFDDTINVPWVLDEDDIGVEKVIDATLALPDPCAAVTIPDMRIHFSSPGKYEILFHLDCPVPVCAAERFMADEPMPASVYQWKDALKIPLVRKWNLISFPLVPLVDPPVDDILDAYQFKSDILSVWYYDRCDDEWLVWPAGYPGGDAELETMEDGKAYWVRIKYDVANPPGTPHDGLWIWGTPKPTPPLGPSAYEVCEGWNMVGVTGYEMFGIWFGGFPIQDHNYLWNWWEFGFPEYSGIYGWDNDGSVTGTAQTWYSLLPFGNWLPFDFDGEGYWISFEHDGFIYPP